MRRARPDFFHTLARQQSPEYLWIGCADSRVPANEIVRLLPGDLFVHRNVANLVVHNDLNCLSVIQYAVEVLRVKHVIVCGHYGCGGVAYALDNHDLGLIDNWLRYVRDLRERHVAELNAIYDKQARAARLCELNVLQQAQNVACTPTIQRAWRTGYPLSVHAWIYAIHDGLIKDLGRTITRADEIPESDRLDSRL
jgi:carbonic anhydrase